ncbi:DinB family protein [Paenibacillus allorhizosphaerae]|uniref:Metal-dependent hydrolase YfiT n=1 Tax=Paenibacillus allorhizosphaerae TaxID=2849866 RepID=A0ABM8VL64_9BACL|nr:DinB family protein [Paenibacillus allorhizosphaerae]CAG7648194.1 Putative metal-dependent hydrolase YfiT [Paenibacillus allorhizosphaerae]
MEALVQSYAEGYDRLVSAMEGLCEEQLVFKPTADKWSIKEVVIHLCDAELIAIERMKRVISEDNPSLLKFYPDAWASRLDYQALDMYTYLFLFRAMRASMTPILENLSDDAWQRTGVHNTAGEQTLQDIVQMFVQHVDRHIKQIERNKHAYAVQRG